MPLKRHDSLSKAPVPSIGKSETNYPTPNKIDKVVIEKVPIAPERYEPLPMKSPHPSYDITGLFLVWQGPVTAENNQLVVVRVYANDEVSNEDWYNASVKYTHDVKGYPVYVRAYVELREHYAPRDLGEPLGKTIRMRVLTQGLYDGTGTPTVTITPVGSGVAGTAQAIMNPDKTRVIGLEQLTCGELLIAHSTVQFSGGGEITAPTAVAEVQGDNVYLVKQEVTKLDSEDQKMASLFVKVTRIYESLPGPFLVWDEYKDERGAVQRTTQFVLSSNVTGGIGIENATFVRTGTPPDVTVTKTWYEPRGDSAIVLTKVTESWIEVHREDKEVTSQHGGGILDVTETRDAVGNQNVETGYLVVSSELTKISPDEQVLLTKKLSDDNAIATLELIDGGGGYTFPQPAVSFSGGDGSGAAADAVLAYPITSVTMTNQGTPTYEAPPLVRTVGGNGGGAFLTAVLGFGIGSITVTNRGDGNYLTPPTCTITGDGSGALVGAGSVVLGFGVYYVQQTFPTFTASGEVITSTAHGLVAGEKVSFVTSGTLPTNFNLKTYYYVLSTGLTANAFKVALTPGGTPISVSGGAGIHRWKYESALTGTPAVNFTGGDGFGAQAQVLIGHPVTSAPLSNPGSSYETTPTVTPVTGEMTAVAVHNTWIDSIPVDTPGTYDAPPLISVSLPKTGGVRCLAHSGPLVAGGLDEIIIDEPGDGYEGIAITVTITPLDADIITDSYEVVTHDGDTVTDG